MRLLYELVIRIFGVAIRLASLQLPKARLWVKGRKAWRQRLRADRGEGKYVWFHCASLGEFEQGRPVIEALKAAKPELKIALSFYSPSGYEVRKDYEKADLVCYLPLDTRRSAKDFIRILQPELAVFVKYEVWPNFFLELKRAGIPLIMISAIFRPGQRYFKWYGELFRRALKSCEWVFVQDDKSRALLQGIGMDHVELSGDTRFDRVSAIAEGAQPIVLAEAFCSGRMCIVAGSSWPAEERILSRVLPKLDPNWCLIIAPHEVDDAHVNSIVEQFGEAAIAYSKAVIGALEGKRVLVIDNIGMLSRLYRYAHIAMIGGGFGKGLHNSLEAAVYGVPLLYGPRHQQFLEAVQLVEAGAALTASSEDHLGQEFQRLASDPERRRVMGENAGNYVQERRGSTSRILKYLNDRHLN